MMIPNYDPSSRLQDAVIIIQKKDGSPAPNVEILFRESDDEVEFQKATTDTTGKIHTRVKLGQYDIIIGGITYKAIFANVPNGVGENQ